MSAARGESAAKRAARAGMQLVRALTGQTLVPELTLAIRKPAP
jgi:hypothetical protein